MPRQVKPKENFEAYEGSGKDATDDVAAMSSSSPLTLKESSSVLSSIALFLPSLKGTILVTGIYVFFLAFGYYQESVFKTGSPNDKFDFPIFIVALLCVANALFSGAIIYLEHITQRHPLDLQAPAIDDAGIPHHPKPIVSGSPNSLRRSFLHAYVLDIEYSVLREVVLSSATYILSMICTNYALSHVNFPTQVLVKSAKSVPVILGGFVFFRKRYPLHDYVAVSAVTVSLIVFNLTRSSGKSAHQTFLGLALLFVSLFCDSMTGPRQDQLLAKVKISSTHLMFLTNVSASVLGLAIWAAFEGMPAVYFCLRHPAAITQICYFCISAALGQLFIFGSLTEFGSLHLTLITTTRKFFTVLLSVILFGHDVSLLQWTCVAAIFVSLALQSYYTKKLKMQVAAKTHKR